MSPEALLQFLFAGLTLGSIYGIVGIGFSLIFNATGAINFAQGEFVVLGAFFTISFQGMDMPLWLAVILSFLLMGIIGVLIEVLFLRPVGSDILALIIVTIGLSLVLRTIALLGWGREPLGLPYFFGGRTLTIFKASISVQSIVIIIAAILSLLFLELFFNRALHGKAMRAIVQDREATRAIGIKPEHYTMMALGLSGALASLAGSTMAPIALLSYFSGGLLALKGFAASIVGGLHKPRAALAGGLFLGVIEAFSSAFLPTGYKDAVALLVLLLVLAFKPEGIFSLGEVRKA